LKKLLEASRLRSEEASRIEIEDDSKEASRIQHDEASRIRKEEGFSPIDRENYIDYSYHVYDLLARLKY
jgi:hypothetical protein